MSRSRLSAAIMTDYVRAAFAANFYAQARKGRKYIMFAVPGHTMCVGTAGAGSTWGEALRAAYLAVGIPNDGWRSYTRST